MSFHLDGKSQTNRSSQIKHTRIGTMVWLLFEQKNEFLLRPMVLVHHHLPKYLILWDYSDACAHRNLSPKYLINENKNIKCVTGENSVNSCFAQVSQQRERLQRVCSSLTWSKQSADLTVTFFRFVFFCFQRITQETLQPCCSSHRVISTLWTGSLWAPSVFAGVSHLKPSEHIKPSNLCQSQTETGIHFGRHLAMIVNTVTPAHAPREARSASWVWPYHCRGLG